MAVNERSFIRIMPESTGDRIGFYHALDIEYQSKTGSFTVGDTVVGSVNGTQGIIIKDTVDNDLSTSGVLSVLLLPGYESKTYNASETLNVGGSPQATVTTAYCIYVNTSTLVSGDNPTYKQNIDIEGQAYTRFAEGAPQFDAFGRMQISQGTSITEHIFQYSKHAEHFTEFNSGTGSITHLPDSSGVLFSTGTASGDTAKRISNRYNKYQPGKSQLIEMTCACGDSGKANVERRWGYGDDNDGLFFELQGTTINLLIRNSASGSLVETRIPQSQWNSDRVDGSFGSKNTSGATLDITKDNIYWIDFQWLGAGRVRFGVNMNGKRIVCHDLDNSNINGLPYMSTGTLPVYAEQTNTGVAGSSSEFRMWCQVVFTDGTYEPAVHHYSSSLQKITVTTTEQALITFRSKQTFGGIDNRVQAYGELLHFYSASEPVLIEVVRDATLGGSPTWTVDPGSNSSVEADTAATTATGGNPVTSIIVPAAGIAALDITHIFGIDGESMHRLADITQTHTYSIRATLLNGTTSDVTLCAKWNEAH